MDVRISGHYRHRESGSENGAIYPVGGGVRHQHRQYVRHNATNNAIMAALRLINTLNMRKFAFTTVNTETGVEFRGTGLFRW